MMENNGTFSENGAMEESMMGAPSMNQDEQIMLQKQVRKGLTLNSSAASFIYILVNPCPPTQHVTMKYLFSAIFHRVCLLKYCRQLRTKLEKIPI